MTKGQLDLPGKTTLGSLPKYGQKPVILLPYLHKFVASLPVTNSYSRSVLFEIWWLFSPKSGSQLP